jgi:propionyl-CoA synthetase
MPNVMGVDQGETYFCASDIGWVVGHSYIVYGPLLRGCTTVLFEGKPVGTPNASTYWRVCAEKGVHAMFTAPTALRAIRREDPLLDLYKQAGVSKLRTLFVAGERGDPDTISVRCQQETRSHRNRSFAERAGFSLLWN